MKEVECKNCKNLFNKRNKSFLCSPKCVLEFHSMPIPWTGCFIWTGQRQYQGMGYGKVKAMKNDFSTHRLSYILNKGEIPKGMCVLHKCDQPLCINPDHLRLGTQRENVDDAFRKGRRQNPKPFYIIPIEKVEKCRLLRAEGKSYEKIAGDLGICVGSAWKIINNKTKR